MVSVVSGGVASVAVVVAKIAMEMHLSVALLSQS